MPWPRRILPRRHPPQPPLLPGAAGGGKCRLKGGRRRLAPDVGRPDHLPRGRFDGGEDAGVRSVVVEEGHLLDALVRPEDLLAQPKGSRRLDLGHDDCGRHSCGWYRDGARSSGCAE